MDTWADEVGCHSTGLLSTAVIAQRVRLSRQRMKRAWRDPHRFTAARTSSGPTDTTTRSAKKSGATSTGMPNHLSSRSRTLCVSDHTHWKCHLKPSWPRVECQLSAPRVDGGCEASRTRPSVRDEPATRDQPVNTTSSSSIIFEQSQPHGKTLSRQTPNASLQSLIMTRHSLPQSIFLFLGQNRARSPTGSVNGNSTDSVI